MEMEMNRAIGLRYVVLPKMRPGPALPCPSGQASPLITQANYGKKLYGSCREKIFMLCIPG